MLIQLHYEKYNIKVVWIKHRLFEHKVVQNFSLHMLKKTYSIFLFSSKFPKDYKPSYIFQYLWKCVFYVISLFQCITVQPSNGTFNFIQGKSSNSTGLAYHALPLRSCHTKQTVGNLYSNWTRIVSVLCLYCVCSSSWCNECIPVLHLIWVTSRDSFY